MKQCEHTERQDDMQASKRIFFVHDGAFHIAVLLLCTLFFCLYRTVCRMAQWFCVLLVMSNITIRMIFCFGMVECHELRYRKKLGIALDGNDLDNIF